MTSPQNTMKSERGGGGDLYYDSDAVFGVKESLIVDFIEHPPGPTPDGGASDVAFFWGAFNFVMARE